MRDVATGARFGALLMTLMTLWGCEDDARGDPAAPDGRAADAAGDGPPPDDEDAAGLDAGLDGPPDGMVGPSPDGMVDATADMTDATWDGMLDDMAVDPPDADPPDAAPDADPPDAAPPTPSYVAEAAHAVLRARHPDDRGVTWNITRDATFDADWLIQLPAAEWFGRPVAEIEAVPEVAPDALPGSFHPDLRLPTCAVDADCGAGRCRAVEATVERVGDAPQRLCVGPSDHAWDAMYRALADARAFADVSSLDFPDNPAGVDAVVRGRFLVALRNALRYLHTTGADVEVRVVLGWLVNDFDWDDALDDRLAALTEGIPADTRLRVHVAGLNYRLLSWNHSKIIATDGEALLQGGVNFYSTDYLGAAPVQDVSMRLVGSPARDAHRYLDAIWQTLVDDYEGFGGDFDGVYTAYASWPPDLDPPGDAPIDDPAPDGDGAHVTSLGRLGLVDRDGVVDPAPSDDAMIAALGAARRRVELSLQDLGSVRDGAIIDIPFWGEVDLSYSWPERLMLTLTRRALDGVAVHIVISETGAGAYSYGWTKREALAAWRDVVEADDALRAAVLAVADSVTDFICDHIDLASVRINDTDDRWRDGAAMGNHAKVWIVDDRAFYVGSQNLYQSNLFEWGLLVDDRPLTAALRATYWQPLWAASARTAVSGPAAEGRCVLRDTPDPE